MCRVYTQRIGTPCLQSRPSHFLLQCWCSALRGLLVGLHQSRAHVIAGWRQRCICTFCSCHPKVVMETDERRAAS